jgi:molecular chaperone DnaK (HSP70)
MTKEAMPGRRDAYCSVCVDFGTAKSKAAASLQGGASVFVHPLALSDDGNPFFLPGRLAVDARNGRVLLGAAAARAGLAPGQETLQFFKTLLSAPDLPRSVRTLAKPAVDPTRRFRQRDLLATFLAFLLRRVDRALSYESTLAEARGRYALRYTRPDWSRDADLQHDLEIISMLREAAHLSRALAATFDAGEVSISGLISGLEAAAANPSSIEIEGAVFEAAAAAAGYLDAAGARSSAILVLDVSAGTTDVGALRFSTDHEWEIPKARRTIDQAGDALDRAILSLLIERARIKEVAAQGRAWRDLIESVRHGKEQLFANGTGVFRVGGKLVRLTAKEALKSAEAREVFEAIEAAYLEGLQAVADVVQRDGGMALTVIAAGGGSRLEAVRNIVRAGKPRRSKVKVEHAPPVPEWASAGSYADSFGPIFPLLSIAIGGAIAPPALLAKSGRTTTMASVS